MTLATFDTREEADYFSERAGRYIWVGIHYDDKNKSLVRITDGTKVTRYDVLWAPGEPNNLNRKEHCVVSGWTYDEYMTEWHKFNDLDCDRLNRFACEKIDE